MGYVQLMHNLAKQKRRSEIWMCRLCEIAGTRDEALRIGCWDQSAKLAGSVRLDCPIERIVAKLRERQVDE